MGHANGFVKLSRQSRERTSSQDGAELRLFCPGSGRCTVALIASPAEKQATVMNSGSLGPSYMATATPHTSADSVMRITKTDVRALSCT
jgi:hypothetical protein